MFPPSIHQVFYILPSATVSTGHDVVTRIFIPKVSEPFCEPVDLCCNVTLISVHKSIHWQSAKSTVFYIYSFLIPV